MIPLPSGWRETYRLNIRKIWSGCFANFDADRQVIRVHLPKWAMRGPLALVVEHERCHAWGIPASGCVAGDPDCLMFELVGNQDGWAEKRRAIRHNLDWWNVRPCPKCRALLRAMGAPI